MTHYNYAAGGRNKIDEDTIGEIIRLRVEENLMSEQIRDITGVGTTSIDKYLKSNGIDPIRVSKAGLYTPAPKGPPLSEHDYRRVRSAKTGGDLSPAIAAHFDLVLAEVNAAYGAHTYARYLKDR